MNRTLSAWTVLVVALIGGGCLNGAPEPLPPQAKTPAAQGTPVPAPAEPAPAPSAQLPPTQSPPVAPPATAPPVAVPPAVQPPAAAPPMIQEPARVGMGAKGHYGGPGLITTPISAYWRVQDRMAINQIISAMQIYVATNGEPPKTHEEFMEKIIQPAAIQLPVLPDGEQYLYDPKQVKLPENTGLMVQRPAP